MFNKIKAFALRHKFISAIIIVAIIYGAYWIYGLLASPKANTSYVTTTAANGTITTSVSGSGQVAALSTISLQFQASGTLIYLPVKNGQSVYQGQLIAQLDTTNAEQTIANDQSSIQSQQISMQRLIGSGTSTAPQNVQDATNNLNQDYQSGYNSVSSVFIDLPTLMTDLQNIVYGNNFNNYQSNLDFYANTAQSYDPAASQFRSSLVKSYQTALTEYTANFNDYKATTRYSNNASIDSILNETYITTKDISQAIKDTNNLIQFYKNTLANYNIKENPLSDTQLATINSDSSKANNDITNLLSIQNTINKDKEAIISAGLDGQSAQLSLQNAQNNLANDKANLANYYIYAPFDGVLGKITAVVGSQVGSGTSIATEVTTQDTCTIPLNEIDAAKVQVGQQVVITFNAIPNLSVAGKVATIDPIGAVTSGVVTYNIQISFDTQDPRVKSGMSLNAQIITDVAQDVIAIPNGAIKTQSGIKYVQVLVNNKPETKVVTTGISNATNTEILSGINVGDKVITQTITTGGTGAGATKATTTTSTTRVPGLGGGFGGIRGGL